MRVLRLLAVLASTFGLTACLNSTTLVKVKPDGSGTVEQTTLMNIAALKGMGGASGQVNGPMMNKADLEQTAARMGEGVRLVSSEPVKGDNGFEGVKADATDGIDGNPFDDRTLVGGEPVEGVHRGVVLGRGGEDAVSV